MKDEILESMNEKADAMRKQIVDILGDTIGKIVKLMIMTNRHGPMFKVNENLSYQ